MNYDIFIEDVQFVLNKICYLISLNILYIYNYILIKYQLLTVKV